MSVHEVLRRFGFVLGWDGGSALRVALSCLPHGPLLFLSRGV